MKSMLQVCGTEHIVTHSLTPLRLHATTHSLTHTHTHTHTEWSLLDLQLYVHMFQVYKDLIIRKKCLRERMQR